MRLPLCVQNVVYLYHLQMSIVKYFSISIRSEFGNKGKVEIWLVQAIDPSFLTITKPLTNKRGKTFCEGLKCVNFSRQMGEKIFKNLSFSRNPLKILLKNLHRETLNQFYLASFSDLGILYFFLLSYNGNNLSVKLLESLC